MIVLLAPIPGGCTLTSALDTDPNLQLNYTYYTTTTTFPSGNAGYDITEVRVTLGLSIYLSIYLFIHLSMYLSLPPQTTSPPPCTTLPADESNVFQVEYTLYRKLLNLGDYKETALFDAIESLLTPKAIDDKVSVI